MPDISPNKILKYLALGLGVVCVLILVREVFLKPKPLPTFEVPARASLIRSKIDFEALEASVVEALLPFKEISLPEKIGRKKPFEPYTLEEAEVVEEVEEEATTTDEE